MQQTNNQLMVILSDMVRVSLETERRINHCLSSMDSHPVGPSAPLAPFGGARDNGTDGRHGGATFSGAAEAPYNPRDGPRRNVHYALGGFTVIIVNNFVVHCHHPRQLRRNHS